LKYVSANLAYCCLAASRSPCRSTCGREAAKQGAGTTTYVWTWVGFGCGTHTATNPGPVPAICAPSPPQRGQAPRTLLGKKGGAGGGGGGDW
jgi:hypothetical protein